MSNDTVTIPSHETRQVRLTLGEAQADKLRRVAKVKGRTMSSVVGVLIDLLDETPAEN